MSDDEFYRGFYIPKDDDSGSVREAIKHAVSQCAKKGQVVIIEKLVVNAPSGGGAEVKHKDYHFYLFKKGNDNV